MESSAPLFGGGSGTPPPRLDTLSSQRRKNGVVGTAPFSGFSAFGEIIRLDREAARAEREAGKAERNAATGEHRRRLEEAFELKVQLIGLKGKQSLGVAGDEPRATGSRSKSGGPTEGAVQGSAAAVSGRVPYICGTRLDCGPSGTAVTGHMFHRRYVAVTNRCCSTSLVASRGPGLLMPPSFHPLPNNVEPSASEIVKSVINNLSSSRTGFEEVVFAGVGEPLLRWPIVREVVRSLRLNHAHLLQQTKLTETEVKEKLRSPRAVAGTTPGKERFPDELDAMPFRLVTNGLWPVASQAVTTPVFGSRGGDSPGTSTLDVEFDDSNRGPVLSVHRRNEMGANGAAAFAAEIDELFDAVSVALNTVDPLQYDQLMEPCVEGVRPGDAHGVVCSLVRECAARGLNVECTVVSRDDVDVTSAQQLAAKLGAFCRVRPYLT